MLSVFDICRETLLSKESPRPSSQQINQSCHNFGFSRNSDFPRRVYIIIVFRNAAGESFSLMVPINPKRHDRMSGCLKTNCKFESKAGHIGNDNDMTPQWKPNFVLHLAENTCLWTHDWHHLRSSGVIWDHLGPTGII